MAMFSEQEANEVFPDNDQDDELLTELAQKQFKI